MGRTEPESRSRCRAAVPHRPRGQGLFTARRHIDLLRVCSAG